MDQRWSSAGSVLLRQGRAVRGGRSAVGVELGATRVGHAAWYCVAGHRCGRAVGAVLHVCDSLLLSVLQPALSAVVDGRGHLVTGDPASSCTAGSSLVTSMMKDAGVDIISTSVQRGERHTQVPPEVWRPPPRPLEVRREPAAAFKAVQSGMRGRSLVVIGPASVRRAASEARDLSLIHI